MPTNLRINLENRPGTLADAAEALGKAGINIMGGAGMGTNGGGHAYFLVEDAATARQALEAAGLEVLGEDEAIVTGIEDKAGALGAIARRVADAGVNITFVYLTADGRLVLGGDDLEKARGAIG